MDRWSSVKFIGIKWADPRYIFIHKGNFNIEMRKLLLLDTLMNRMLKKPPIKWTIWDLKTCKWSQNSVHQTEMNKEALSKNHGQTEIKIGTEGQITAIDLYYLKNSKFCSIFYKKLIRRMRKKIEKFGS